MQPLYIVLLLFIVLWGIFFKLLSLYASRMNACSGGGGRFFWTNLVSLVMAIVTLLLAEVLPYLHGGVMNLF